MFNNLQKKPHGSHSEDTKKSMIIKLIRFRASKYSNNQIISETDLPLLRIIAKGVGIKILNRNHLAESDKALLPSKYSALLDELFIGTHTQEAAYFCDQLLQYHTLLCSKESLPSLSLSELDQLLDKKKATLGDTSSNLFIIEYKLIKLYHDLTCLNLSIKGSMAPIADPTTMLINLNEKSLSLQNTVDAMLKDKPNHIFMNYLSLAASYCCALSVETFNNMLKTSHHRDFTDMDLRPMQLGHIEKTIAAFNKVKELHESYQFCQGEKPFVEGLAFTLDQDILKIFPENDMMKLETHLHSFGH